MKKRTFFDYTLFLEAWIFLCLAKLLIIFFPFKKIASMIGRSQVESPGQILDLTKVHAIEISIIRAAKYAIFKSKCYDQALVTTFMLKNRKISSTIYFGLNKGAEQLSAHAWVRCGDKIVSGRLGYERFTPVAWFGSLK